MIREQKTRVLQAPVDAVSFTQAQSRVLARWWLLRIWPHPMVHPWPGCCASSGTRGRVSGPDLMWALLGRCAAEGLPVYLFGSTPDTLQALMVRAMAAFPALQIAGHESPPFRALSAEEDADAVSRINASGAGLVFVGLGCPKQEHWMLAHRGRINAVMLGVGAAFDFHAGTVSRAPLWMRDNGLEWLHRLASEPRRLWKRYLVINTLFVLGAAKQLLLKK